MEPGKQITFGPFRLDQDQGQLWRDDHVVALQPKPLAVLQYLAQRPGQIVSSKELLKTVWAGVYVTKAVVKECMRAIRGALDEDTSAPQYIETVGREGYRFIREVQSPGSKVQSPQTTLAPSSQLPAPTLVGRDAELARLHKLLDKALDGERQLVFVTGEPGIGKTTIIDRFREQIQASSNITIGYGQCVEQYGGGEAYLPVLEAMGRLCREPGEHAITATLRQYAPTWLVQLSGVIEEAEAQTLRLQVQGATQQRMLREMAEAIAAGTARRLLVLILEDLHWSDQATIELLAYLAQRRERTRLMIIGTYRPADLVLGNHPLKAMKQELHAKQLCEEVRLELLSEHAVRAYLSQRFPHHQFPSELAEVIHRRTEGNALFMVNVVEELLQQGALVEEDADWRLQGDLTQVQVPHTLRQLIEKQIAQRSDDEQRLLEVASVVGTEFTVAVVAAVLKHEIDEVEEVCEDLAWQGHFLQEQGIAEWLDGTVSGRYGFRHALYQNVLYDRTAEARRVRLHRLIGERLDAGYREQAKESAAELAVHFEQGHDYQRAVQYLQHAGENASRKNAHREAITHFTKGVELLKAFPDTPERTQQELALQLGRGPSLWILEGSGAPEVRAVYSRALELCRQLEETPSLLPTLLGLRSTYVAQADYRTAHELSERCLRLAQKVQDSALLLQAHLGMGVILVYFGEFAPAREHLEQAFSLYDPQHHNPHVIRTPQDPGVVSLTYLAWTLWLLGYPEQAVKKAPEALALAQDLSHPFSLGWALNLAAKVRLFRREGAIVQEQTEAMLRLATEKGIPYWTTEGTMMRRWALAEQGQEEEGIAQMRQGFTAWRAMGTNVVAPFLLAWQIEVYGRMGQIEEGQSALTGAFALVDKTGEGFYAAELHRLKGELTLQQFKVQGSKFQVEKSPRSRVQSRKIPISDP